MGHITNCPNRDILKKRVDAWSFDSFFGQKVFDLKAYGKGHAHALQELLGDCRSGSSLRLGFTTAYALGICSFVSL